MSESFENFGEMLDESIRTIRPGEIVKGTVISVKPDQIMLDIGYKSEGVINRADYSADSSLDLTTVCQLGDEIEAKVRKLNDGEGLVSLSHRDVLTEKNNQRIQEALDAQEVLTGTVERVVNGGLSVNYDGVRVFVPASLVSDMFERDLSKYAGQDIEFVITEFVPQKHRIIGNRKMIVAERKAAARKALLESVKEGDVIDGTVKNVTDFGAFVDLGGADGLLHISEMGWGRTENPKKAYKSGDTVRVMIKSISPEGKIALTRKFPDENPWVLALDKYKIGSIVEGKVARLADFGAFVNLEQGIDALLHVSQIALERIDKPSDVLKVGDIVRAKVTDMDAEAKKISLSVKAILNEEKRKAQAAAEARANADVTDFYTDTDEPEPEPEPQELTPVDTPEEKEQLSAALEEASEAVEAENAEETLTEAAKTGEEA